MSDAPSPTASQGTPTRVERTFVDAEGARWRVYEQPFAEYDRRRGLSLIFASDGAVRRVRNYPSNWAEIPESELIALSWMA